MAMKFRAHDTFFIRKGWLSKGMKYVRCKPDVFVAKEENLMDVPGIGTNMVKALRYWLQAVGEIHHNVAARAEEQGRVAAQRIGVFTVPGGIRRGRGAAASPQKGPHVDGGAFLARLRGLHRRDPYRKPLRRNRFAKLFLFLKST